MRKEKTSATQLTTGFLLLRRVSGVRQLAQNHLIMGALTMGLILGSITHADPPPSQIVIGGELTCPGTCPCLFSQCFPPCVCPNGGPTVFCRSAASCERTVLILEGNQAVIDFSFDGEFEQSYQVQARYSNDNFGPLETVSLSFGNNQSVSFNASDTSDWNSFVMTGSLGQVTLSPGAQQLTINISGGDKYGLEIDNVVLNCVGPCCGIECDNGVFCDGIEVCDNQSGCQSGTPPNCDNGVFCDGTEVCDAASDRCIDGPDPACDDQIDCTEDVCNSITDSCEHSPNDQLCDDGDPCTDSSCDAQNGCQHVNNTIACDDKNACTVLDRCLDGNCVGDSLSCDDQDGCTADSCEPLTGDCQHDPISPCCPNGSCEVSESCITCEEDCCGPPFGSAFTYQGQLKQDGTPLSDTADFEFSLWNAVVNGDQVGSRLRKDNVFVNGGLFALQLDFGKGAFDGEKRWLEIAVRRPHDPLDDVQFVDLSPRQEITGAPYAVFADRARNGLPAGAVILWTGSACPGGFTRLAELDGRFLVGGASYDPIAGGSNTHLHGAGDLSASDHTHEGGTGTHTHGFTAVTSNAGGIDPVNSVTTASSPGNQEPGSGGGNITGATEEVDSRPEFATVLLCQKN